MTAGTLVAPKPKQTASGADLPPYNAETQEITYEGNTQKAPDGTKFVLDDGRTFILRHAKMSKGGWKLLRTAKKKDATTAPTTTASADKKK